MLIYAVDDMDWILRSMVTEVARAAPEAEVQGFPSGEAALAQIRTRPCSVLLTDVELLPMNGLALAEAVHRDYPAVEILFITGENSQKLLDMGIPLARCLFKPAEARSIARKLEELPSLPPFPAPPPERGPRISSRRSGGLLGRMYGMMKRLWKTL